MLKDIDKLVSALTPQPVDDQRGGTYPRINVLDHGHVTLIDVMGDDARIAQTARVSYGEGTTKVNNDAGLIDYLVRHRHTTPLEAVIFTFHIKMPIFVARQWFRHRSASPNEYSARYSIVKDEFYLPEELRLQSKTNNQGSSAEALDDLTTGIMLDWMASEYDVLYERYQKLLSLGVTREQARIILPQATYTEFYWTQNLHNLLHLVSLRADSHSQTEIRPFALAACYYIRQNNPAVWESVLEHRVNSTSVTRFEARVIRMCLERPSLDVDRVIDQLSTFYNKKLSKGRRREVKKKVQDFLEMSEALQVA